MSDITVGKIEQLTSGTASGYPNGLTGSPAQCQCAVKDQRIATLDADLAASREREAALAATVEYLVGLGPRVPAKRTCIDYDPAGSTYEYTPDPKAVTLFGEDKLVLHTSASPYGEDYYRLRWDNGAAKAILAAHDAEVARNAKVEALEEFKAWSNKLYLTSDAHLTWLVELKRRIAAFEAQVAELTADQERRDWEEKNPTSIGAVVCFGKPTVYFVPGRGPATYTSRRAAIDAARGAGL